MAVAGNQQSGVVKKWIEEKGFGFIIPHIPTADGRDVFVHCKSLMDGRRDLNVGENVTYVMGIGRNGNPQAVEVRGDGSGRSAEQRDFNQGAPRAGSRYQQPRTYAAPSHPMNVSGQVPPTVPAVSSAAMTQAIAALKEFKAQQEAAGRMPGVPGAAGATTTGLVNHDQREREYH